MPNLVSQIFQAVFISQVYKGLFKYFTDPFAYEIVADIQKNVKGHENLYFANHKFNKHGKINVNGQQRWQCTKQASRKCMAAVRTMEVDGVHKMKILVAEHLR